MRIFVADGELLFRALLRLNLRKHPSIHMSEAGDGYSALQKIAVFRPNLLIVAAELNLLSGIQLLHKLNSSPDIKAFTVLLSSSEEFSFLPYAIHNVNAVVYRHALCKQLPDLIKCVQGHLLRKKS